MHKICCCTGHRPNGFPYAYKSDVEKHENYIKNLTTAIENAIERYDIKEFYSGMAMGVDLDFADIVLNLRDTKYSNIRLCCIIPCLDQCKKWDVENIVRYNRIIDNANSSIIISKRYNDDCMLARNRYMVERSDLVIAVWNGCKKGGTWYTIRYAMSLNKPITYVEF